MSCSAGKIGMSTPPIGCVLELPGLPGGGNKIYDRSPYGNIGTITGATWKRLPSGLWYLDFDGQDDYVNLGNPASLDVHIWSLEAWLNYSSGTAFITKRGTTATFSSEIYGTEQVIFAFNDGAWHNCISDANSVPPNVWAHLVGTWDGTYIRAYRNGALIKTSADFSAFTPPTTTDTVYIGRYSSAYITGKIALVRIYNRALSALEIQNQFNQEKHLFGVW